MKTIIVIGAGIVGVSTAIWLQRSGFKVTIIDQKGPATGASHGNAGILAAQMIATGDSEIFDKTVKYKENLKEKIVKANKELSSKEFKYRVQ